MKTLKQIEKAAKKVGCQIIQQDDKELFSIVSKDSHHTSLFTQYQLEKYFCMKF
jgi:hypothetical protein